MKSIVFSVIFLFSVLIGYSQRIAKVSADYTYYAPETMSVEEAKRIALERAKIQAIADEFGTVISLSNSTIISNKNGRSDTQYFSLGGSDVKGEWIETIGDPSIEIAYADNVLIVKVRIKGRARAVEKRTIQFIAKLYRNQVADTFETDSFINGDKVFLGFQTPINGSVIVYLIDYKDRQVYCLLPYSSSSQPSYEVRNDTPYVFFSEKNAPLNNDGTIDEYSLTCASGDVENNEIVILFSPDKLIKNNSERISSNMPRKMSLENYSKWLSKLKISVPELYIINKQITIKQKNL